MHHLLAMRSRAVEVRATEGSRQELLLARAYDCSKCQWRPRVLVRRLRRSKDRDE